MDFSLVGSGSRWACRPLGRHHAGDHVRLLTQRMAERVQLFSRAGPEPQYAEKCGITPGHQMIDAAQMAST